MHAERPCCAPNPLDSTWNVQPNFIQSTDEETACLLRNDDVLIQNFEKIKT